MSYTVGKIAAICLTVATFFVAGCSRSDPQAEQARVDAEVAAQLDSAKKLLYSAQIDQAVRQLEALDADHPNRPAIIEQLAFAYSEVPDPAMAALYFDRAYELSTDRSDLALFAAEAHAQMKDWPAAATAYQSYLKDEPMDVTTWKRLAQAQRSAGRLQPSLDAWLRAFKAEDDTPNAAEALEMGNLYYELGNQAQAGNWWNYTLKQTDAEGAHAQARIGLLRLALAREHWDQAEQLLARIDQQSPTLIDNSDLAGVRQQLQDLRNATTVVKPGTTQTVVSTTSPATSNATSTSGGTTSTAGSSGTTPPTTTNSGTTNVADISDAAGGSKIVEGGFVAPPGQILVTEADGTVTTQPAPAPTTSTTGNTASANTNQSGTTTTSGEQVLVATWGNQGDGTPQGMTEVTVTAENVLPGTPAGDGSVAPTPLADTTSSVPQPEPPEVPVAETEYEKGLLAYDMANYPAAIRHFQESLISENSENAQTYYDISRAYYAIGQWQQAELFASEAMRRKAGDIKYRAQYLRAIQKSQPRQRLMEELVIAYREFPRSPDIALALARGYDKIEGNRRDARFMYERFLELAPPDHPKRDEIEQLLTYYGQ